MKMLLILALFFLVSCASNESRSVKGDPTPNKSNQNSSVSQLEMIRMNKNNFKKIKNPTEEAQLLYLKLNGHPKNLSHIDNMTEEVQLSIVRTLPSSISYIKRPSTKTQLHVLKRNNGNYIFIKSMSEEAQLYLVARRPSAFYDTYVDGVKNDSFIKSPYPSVKKHPKFIAYGKEKRIAKLKREREIIENAKKRKQYSSSSYNSSSSGSAASTGGYSPPQPRTCTRVVYDTQYMPGYPGQPQNRVQVPKHEEYPC